MADSTETNIPPTSTPTSLLTDDNYAEWLINIKAMLRTKKLWKFTQEPLSLGTIPADATDKAKVKKELEDAYKEKEEKHIKAADLMTIRISGPVKRKLVARDFDDGYYMLRHLQEIYALATETSFMQLLQELMALRPDGGYDTIKEYLQKVKTLTERIDATNIQLTPN